MKRANFLKGIVLSLMAALIFTAAPVQKGLFAKENSTSAVNKVENAAGKHKHKHKKHKKGSKTTKTTKTTTKTDNTQNNKKK